MKSLAVILALAVVSVLANSCVSTNTGHVISALFAQDNILLMDSSSVIGCAEGSDRIQYLILNYRTNSGDYPVKVQGWGDLLVLAQSPWLFERFDHFIAAPLVQDVNAFAEIPQKKEGDFVFTKMDFLAEPEIAQIKRLAIDADTFNLQSNKLQDYLEVSKSFYSIPSSNAKRPDSGLFKNYYIKGDLVAFRLQFDRVDRLKTGDAELLRVLENSVVAAPLSLPRSMLDKVNGVFVFAAKLPVAIVDDTILSIALPFVWAFGPKY